MNQALTSINKISSPDLSAVYPRTRLFDRMDRALKQRVVWTGAPAGSGKSTFAASYLAARKLPHIWYQVDEGDADIATLFYYMGLAVHKAAPDNPFPLPLLTKEFQQGIPVFTRRYFEELFSRLPRPAAIVFDNYHTVSADSPFHDVIRCALEELPDGLNVILISREEPPAPLARLRSLRKMSFITWHDLRLDREEMNGVVQHHDGSSLDEKEIGQLLEKTRGWLAGVMFLLERGALRLDVRELDLKASPALFDYFASELFDTTDPALRDFLLKTSLLDKFTPQMADRLTGGSGAAAILEQLHARNYFTEKFAGDEPGYQYHPLFKEFLRRKAEELLPGDSLARIERTAAGILEANGQVEHAAELLIAGRDWQEIAGLIRRAAPALIAQGRGKTLEVWIVKVPRETTAVSPWLDYWLGVCRFGENPAEARELFERSFHQFRTERDGEGTFLAWSGIANSLNHEMEEWRELDRWLALLDELLAEFPEFPSPQVETRFAISLFTSLVLRQTDHERLEQWEGRLAALLDKSSNAVLRMKGTYARLLRALWTGDYAKAKLLLDAAGSELEQREVSPLARVMIKSLEAYFYWLTARGGLCRQAAGDGLAAARASGVHIFDSRLLFCMAKCALLDGDRELFTRYLRDLEPNQRPDTNLNRINYYFCVAFAALLDGDTARATGCLDAAETPVARIGSLFHEGLWRLGKAQVSFAMGGVPEAISQVELALGISRRIRSSNLEFMSLLTSARFLFCRGGEERGLQMLKQGLALGRSRGYEYFIWWDPKMIAPLCVRALKEGIEVDYVRDLVRRRHLVPAEPPLDCERWPWPVEITTLGEFGISADGRPLKFPGKVQKKPQEMLKALITLGGAEKREGQIADFLWPDADGDTARSSFKVTLHRLRQLLGHEDAIRMREGKVVMDRHHFWCDAWTFEYLLNEAQVKGETGLEAEAVRLTEKALALFRGQFLADDRDKPWAAAMRTRLKNKFVLNTVALGRFYQERNERKKSVDCYLRGLEVDPHAEEIFQNLMLCHLAAGLRADAVAVYHNCRLALAEIGLAPSSRTEEIYRTAMKGL